MRTAPPTRKNAQSPSRDSLSYFEHSYTTGGLSEAVNGRLELLRGSAPGVPKPHPLHPPSTPRNRRIQSPTTPPIMKSLLSGDSVHRPRVVPAVRWWGRGRGVSTPEIGLGLVYLQEVFEVVLHRVSEGHTVEFRGAVEVQACIVGAVVVQGRRLLGLIGCP